MHVIGFDEACACVTAAARPLGVETVPLDEAWNRVLAEAVVAERFAPEAAVSAMDGYAVRDADLRNGPVRLKVIGEAFAGGMAQDQPLEPGACVRIFTGAQVPPGADRVVIQEKVRTEPGAAWFDNPPGAARHIRAAGSDFRPGDVLLPAGTLLTPQALVTAAAAGQASLNAYLRPRVFILSTGDELVEPGDAAAPGAIFESVSFGVAALARAWGAEVVGRARLGDDLDVLRQAAGAALATADVVIATGGASVGTRDFSYAMFEPFGVEPLFRKVAIKPGKPVWMGRVGSRFAVGLPGNPAAAMVTARLFLAPLLAGLGGQRPEAALDWEPRSVACAAPPGCERDGFLRAMGDADSVRPLGVQDSSAQAQLGRADLLMRRRPQAPALSAGDTVEVLRL